MDNSRRITCARCGLVETWNGDWLGFLCPRCADELDAIDSGEKPWQPRQFKLTVPTYNGNYYDKKTLAILSEEYSEPNTSVLVHDAEGVRIVLATHGYNDMEKPDIQIERRPRGWVIFLHPEGGGDPSGYVYFLDDGRSFLMSEQHGKTPAIEILEPGEELEELDMPSCGNCDRNDLGNLDEPIITHAPGPR